MTNDEIRDIVAAAIQRIQSVSGRPCPPLQDTIRPLLDVEGFDSLNGLEATIEIEQKLGSLRIENLFLSESGKSARTLGTIVNEIVRAQRGAA